MSARAVDNADALGLITVDKAFHFLQSIFRLATRRRLGLQSCARSPIQYSIKIHRVEDFQAVMPVSSRAVEKV